MRRLSAFLLVVCVSVHASAAQIANVLVMGEDAAVPGRETVVVARDTPVFRQVLETLSQEIAREGFAVYDERAVTLDAFKQDRKSRGEAELLDIARTVKSPAVDAVLIFTVSAGVRELAYTTNVSAHLAARLIDTRTGRKIASAEVSSPPNWKAPAGCVGTCLISHIGDNARDMASELGAELAQKLTASMPAKETFVAALQPVPRVSQPHVSPAPGYKLVFDGFSSDDIAGVEEYLVAFKGYKGHRAEEASPERVAYRYETAGGQAGLQRALRMMVERLGNEAEISYTESDATFVIAKKTR